MGDNITGISEFLDMLFSYGQIWVYLMIFAACFIENIFPPFPGDSFIVGAGALVGWGRLDIITSALLIVAGGIASIILLYFFGQNYGREFFIKKNYKYFSAEDIYKVDKHLKKYGPLILIFSRFVIGFRSALAIAVGISRYSLVKTIIYSIISYILFGGLLFYGAVKTVENLELLEKYFKTYQMVFWPLLICGLLLFIIWKIKKVKENLA